jgi:hypothetical protein
VIYFVHMLYTHSLFRIHAQPQIYFFHGAQKCTKPVLLFILVNTCTKYSASFIAILSTAPVMVCPSRWTLSMHSCSKVQCSSKRMTLYKVKWKYTCREFSIKGGNSVLFLFCIVCVCTVYTTNTAHTACFIYNLTLL